MGSWIDLTQRRFGRLVALTCNRSSQPRKWLCQCDCGTTCLVQGVALRSGHTRSCGCWKRDALTVRATTHGRNRTPEHRAWKGLIQRCTNPNVVGYQYYGGRGIAVCDRWRHDFSAFFVDMGEKPTPKHTIERKDNNGPYSPDNCIWATRSQQANNKRRTTYITWDGRSQSMGQWAHELGLHHETLRYRLRHWPIDRAMSQRR